MREIQLEQIQNTVRLQIRDRTAPSDAIDDSSLMPILSQGSLANTAVRTQLLQRIEELSLALDKLESEVLEQSRLVTHLP